MYVQYNTESHLICYGTHNYSVLYIIYIVLLHVHICM